MSPQRLAHHAWHTLFIVGGTLLFAAGSYAAKLNPATDKVWVIIRPLNCLGNLWEKDWLANHKNKIYPHDKEMTVIRAFFKKKGVAILDARTKPYEKGEYICQTCGCPRGDTLFLLTTGADVPKMLKFGFKDRFPDQPPKK